LKYLELLGFLNGFNPFFKTQFGIFTIVTTPKPTQRKKVVGRRFLYNCILLGERGDSRA